MRCDTHVEDIVCKLAGVTEREELPVNLLEFVLVQLARRAILEESFVLFDQFVPSRRDAVPKPWVSPIAEVPVMSAQSLL